MYTGRQLAHMYDRMLENWDDPPCDCYAPGYCDRCEGTGILQPPTFSEYESDYYEPYECDMYYGEAYYDENSYI